MKLRFQRIHYGNEVFIETKYGEMSMRQFIEIARKKCPLNDTSILAEADIDHAQYYEYMHGHSKSLGTIFRLLDVFGYDVQIVKQTEEQ
jgi:hypothetical protein